MDYGCLMPERPCKGAVISIYFVDFGRIDDIIIIIGEILLTVMSTEVFL